MASVLNLDLAKSRAREIVAWARRAPNWYRPGASLWVPGVRPRHVLENGTVRAVFSWTMQPDGEVFRHLSISSLHGPKLPDPIMVWTLASFFDFSGVVPDEHGLVREPSKTWKLTMRQPTDEQHNEVGRPMLILAEYL